MDMFGMHTWLLGNTFCAYMQSACVLNSCKSCAKYVLHLSISVRADINF